jgi:multicomponent Na+:H+ antiporter subunit E
VSTSAPSRPGATAGPAAETPRGLRRVTAHWHLALWLTVVWVGLWGDLTPANVLGGIVVSVVLLVALPLPTARQAGRVRPVAALRLAGRFALDLVTANVVVAWQVLRVATGLGPPLRQGVVGYTMRTRSERLITTVANMISLTPGTLTVEIDRDDVVIYVHSLDLDSPEALRAEVRALESRVIRALGSDEEVRALSDDADHAIGSRVTSRRPGGAA